MLKTIVVEHTKQIAKLQKKNEYILIQDEKLHFSYTTILGKAKLYIDNDLTTII